MSASLAIRAQVAVEDVGLSKDGIVYYVILPKQVRG